MEEEKKPEQEPKLRSNWQITKESWYDKIPLNVKQLDIIIYVSLGLLALTFVGIFLDAIGVF